MDSIETLTIPQNLTAEQQALGWLLSGDKRGLDVLGKLQETDFWREAHRVIFRACRATFGTRGDCVVPTVAMQLRAVKWGGGDGDDRQDALAQVGGQEYLAALVRGIGTRATLAAAIDELHALGDMRGMLHAITEAREILASPAVNPREAIPQATGVIQAALATRQGSATMRDMREAMPEFAAWHDALLSASRDVTGPRFGIAHVDQATGGLGDHLLVVIKGLPKFGKSSIALQAAVTTAADFMQDGSGRVVVVFSLEDMEWQYRRRIVGHVANIPNDMLKRGAYTAYNRATLEPRVVQARTLSERLPLYVDATTRNVDEICARTMVLGMTRPVGMVVVDYAQLVQGGRGKWEQELIAYQVGQLEWLAKQCRCPLILASQTTVKEDGSMAGKNSAQYDEKATLSLMVWRGPLDLKAMSQDERRRSPEVYLLNTHNRRGEAFGPRRCTVDYATDRWSECTETYGGGMDYGNRN